MSKRSDSETKPTYRKYIVYDEDFEAEIIKFQRNILKDQRFADKTNPSLDRNRFSRALRKLIQAYNSKMEKNLNG